MRSSTHPDSFDACAQFSLLVGDPLRFFPGNALLLESVRQIDA